MGYSENPSSGGEVKADMVICVLRRSKLLWKQAFGGGWCFIIAYVNNEEVGVDCDHLLISSLLATNLQLDFSFYGTFKTQNKLWILISTIYILMNEDALEFS